MELKIYRCPVCGNVVIKIKDGKTAPSCCGKQMIRLVANTKCGAGDIHFPNDARHDRLFIVSVGNAMHPMLSNHYIEWIMFQTSFGFQIHFLKPGQSPQTKFTLTNAGEKPVALYAYCNRHGLFKQELSPGWF